MATRHTAQGSATNMQLPGDVLEGIYTTMQRIRLFDEMTHLLFEEGIVKGTAHSMSAKRLLLPRSVPIFAKMILWQAITAAMGIV